MMDIPYYWMYSFPMRKGILDDDYYFYEDGRILHVYDKTQNKLNLEEIIEATSIPTEKRQTMIDACPIDKKKYNHQNATVMKKSLLITLILILVVGQKLHAYDFSAIAGSGQTLYYSVVSSSAYTCEVVSGTAKPSGHVRIPDSVYYNRRYYKVVQVGVSAFYDCDSLLSISFPKSVTKICRLAFANCSNIEYCTIPNTIQSIEDVAFQSSYIKHLDFDFCPSTWTFGQGLTYSMYENTFQYAHIDTLIIGGNVRYIGAAAFCNCYFSQKVVIPENVKGIGSRAFCSNPSSMPSWPIIEMKHRIPPIITSGTFRQGSSQIQNIIVPCGALSLYRNSNNWADLSALYRLEECMAAYCQLSSSDINLGNVGGGGSCYIDDSISIVALPKTNCLFLGWSDGNTENPRAVYIESDTSFVAIFVQRDTLYDTTYIDIHDTTCVENHIHDTIRQYVHDTTFYAVYIHDTTMVHDTSYINVEFPVHDTAIVTVHDTVIAYINVPVHDTTYIEVHDTTIAYINVPVYDTTYIEVHDTTRVSDTVIMTEYVTMYDTTIVHIHDTTYITQTDTVTSTVYDTVTNTVFDTITNFVHDTTIFFSIDTLRLHDTVFVYDTIYIYDTIYVGVDEVETICAKIYTSHGGRIVVEGAEGNTVWLFDVNGHMIETKQDEYLPLYFDVLASGTYLVKIGNHTAQKIVVIR